MDLGIEGRRALVIAGSKGLGAGAARSLAAEGARVALTSRDPSGAQALATELGGHALRFDTDDLDDIDRLVDEAVGLLGGIDILVLNTGGPPSHEHPFETTTGEWNRTHRSLVLSPFETMRRVVPRMAERGWGRVIVISSRAATHPIQRIPLANAYRPALLGNIGLLATRYGRDGVTINAVVPGVFRTDRALAGRNAEDLRRTEATIAIGRMGETRELGDVVAFLASERAGYITGSVLHVDGGLGAVPL